MIFKDIIYAITCLLFSIIIGGAVYEHLAIIPFWSSGPPASLTMFQGEYGLNSEPFWITIHPVTILFLIFTLIISWITTRRFNIVVTLIGYILILVATATYFVPELLDIINTPFLNTSDNDLTSRSKMWETLSIIRLFLLIVLSLILFSGLTKNNQKITTDR